MVPLGREHGPSPEVAKQHQTITPLTLRLFSKTCCYPSGFLILQVWQESSKGLIREKEKKG